MIEFHTTKNYDLYTLLSNLINAGIWCEVQRDVQYDAWFFDNEHHATLFELQNSQFIIKKYER